MNYLFLFGGLLQLLIFIFIFIKFLKHYGDERKKIIVKSFSFLGFLYLVFSLSSFLWAFEVLIYSMEDYLFIYAILVLLQSLILFRIVYLFSENRKLFLFLVLQLISVGFLFFSSSIFILLSIICSFLFTLLIFIDLISRGDHYRNVGYFGILYSTLALIFFGILIIQSNLIYIFSFVLSIFLFVFLFVFFNELKKYKILPPSKVKKEKSYFFTLFSHLIFVITIVNFIFIGTIGIHEFGHFSVSKFYDCEYQKIVYENDFFHTEILCGDLEDHTMVLLGGVLFPLILAIFLFLLGGKLMQEIGILIAGFNLTSVSKDLFDLGLSEPLTISIVFVGGLLIMYGILLLSKGRTEEPIYFPGRDNF